LKYIENTLKNFEGKEISLKELVLKDEKEKT
jgi:hypothetical protein